jgi:hypothetical protein
VNVASEADTEAAAPWLRAGESEGWHAKYRRSGAPTRTVIVPIGRKNLLAGTFHSIIEQPGLIEDDF